jgi:hypothetical protein
MVLLRVEATPLAPILLLCRRSFYAPNFVTRLVSKQNSHTNPIPTTTTIPPNTKSATLADTKISSVPKTSSRQASGGDHESLLSANLSRQPLLLSSTSNVHRQEQPAIAQRAFMSGPSVQHGDLETHPAQIFG